jgi:SAM-dependent methyltransferase
MFSDVDRNGDPRLAVAYLESAAVQLASVKDDLLARLHIEPGEYVLDLGCGAGHDLVRLHESGAIAVGVDRSVGMIVESRDRCPSAEVTVGDGSALPFAGATFDACRIERVLQHVKEPSRVLREVNRVLRAGGRVVVFEPDWGSLAIDSDRPHVSDALTAGLMAGIAQPRIGLQLRRYLVDADFEDVEISVDVGRYTSIGDLHQFLSLDRVFQRAISDGHIAEDDVEGWNAEMRDRSRRRTFQAMMNRVFGVAASR